ncbi:MAG: tRNA 2-thiocytidine(32) synthetase TtcA [Zoogloeaceae bacterium]|nr:tRNA 2-thiocytidine(32) synthetase TtcA [Zoogloeaceae bacterium]
MQSSQTLQRLEKWLLRKVGKAIAGYHMIEAGDTLLVCVSGGKDSHTLLHLLRLLQHKSPVSFNLIAMNLDQKQPGFPAEVLPDYFQKIGVDYRIVEADTYSIVQEKILPGKTACSLCSRLRRGIIYRTAKEVGANKIALGHHRDDLVHTLFLNLLFGGRLKAMPPKLRTDDGAHIVIRPLACCAEEDIARYARGMNFPIVPCGLCGSQDNLQRQKIRVMMQEWDRRFPGRTESVFTALQNVVPSHLADNALFDFQRLRQTGAGGDETTDDDTLCDAPELPQTSVPAFPLPVCVEKP